MYQSLEGLEPKRVLELFSNLCEIPHGSGNEKAISDFIRDFCQHLHLDTYQDEAWNLIIKKPATQGYENAPICILQAHMDMVCEKKADTVHDFASDPLRVLRDGDRIHADGTTLGADDGTGVAFAMAVLESSDLPHPALEVVLTSNEEAGMTGVNALDFSRLAGRVVINLDCSDEGIVVGCAGTVAAEFTQLIERQPLSAGETCLALRIGGLLGGHSGLDIRKERGNANVIAARVLHRLGKTAPVRVVSMTGGTQANAITRDHTAVIAVNQADESAVLETFGALTEDIRKELKISDPDAFLALTKTNAEQAPFSAACTKRWLDLLLLLPSGVICMNMEVPGLPELSGNFGILHTDADTASITVLYRSCYASRKQQALDIGACAAACTNTHMKIITDTPVWEYRADSRLSALIQRIFEREYGKPIPVEVSHGGNECGTFFCKFPDADIVCTGTRIIAPHTPNESVLLSVIQKEWNMLRRTLEGMLTY